MESQIKLNAKEGQLRNVLLCTSEYIGGLDGHTKPTLRFTGGWVRDKLLGESSHDIDVGIDNMTGYQFAILLDKYIKRPETMMERREEVLGSLARIEANPEKSKHLETTKIKLLGVEIDLVNLRKEAYAEDSRTPTMEFGTPKEDAMRRDATINALFYNLETGQVEDFTKRGLEDMKRKLIKTPLDPLQTFEDDPLRVLRCIRFASRLEYQIAREDETSMSDQRIKAALRLKISRERIGVEVTKMLKGPHPFTAIALLDRLNLYNDVFTDPTDNTPLVAETSNWNKAYGFLSDIIQARATDTAESTYIKNLGLILIRNDNDGFLSWMAACFVPWARTMLPEAKIVKKRSSIVATRAARDGIKADNKICKVLEDAVSNLSNVISLKNATFKGLAHHSESSRRVPSRDIQGQAIRSWGPDWRSTVLFAMLTEVSEAGSIADANDVSRQYSDWMSELQAMDLLDADKIVPIVKGDQLSKALGGIKTGPWLKKALEIAMEWQLLHPEEKDAAGGIAEVVARKQELGLS